MTMHATERLSPALAAEIRATCGRLGVSHAQLARRMGKNDRWMSARISLTASVDMTVDEALEMANALGVEAEGVFLAALRACRDSNPKPSDLVFWEIVASVNGPLAAECRNRTRWVLAR